jgi:hypothetical protein
LFWGNRLGASRIPQVLWYGFPVSLQNVTSVLLRSLSLATSFRYPDQSTLRQSTYQYSPELRDNDIFISSRQVFMRIAY